MKIAVALHLFNYRLLSEFKGYLMNLTVPYDLFLTVPDDGAAAAFVFPKATIIPFHPNLGMDVGGFFTILPFLFHGQYDVVLKLHSKSHDAWRREMIYPLCGTTAQVTKALAEFKDPLVGAVGAKRYLMTEDQNFGGNAVHVRELAKQWNLAPTPAVFLGGTIFWMRVSLLWTIFGAAQIPTVIRTLNTPFSLDWAWYLNYYPELVAAGINTPDRALQHWGEYGMAEDRIPNALIAWKRGLTPNCNGMIEHAYERLFGLIVRSQGMRWVGL